MVPGGKEPSLKNDIATLSSDLAAKERQYERMKMANQYIKHGNIEGLLLEGWKPEQITRLMKPDGAGSIGFPAWQIKSHLHSIIRLRQRIARLGPARSHVAGVSLVDDGKLVRLFFDKTPTTEITQMLKVRSFNWSKDDGAWVRKLSQGALFSARQVIQTLAGVA